MKVAIIAVGSELLGSTRLDTNSLLLSEAFERFGLGVARKSVVPDELQSVADELLFSLEHSEVVVITGGLGPTADDLTKDAVSRALGLPLKVDPAVLAHIERIFSQRGLKMPAVNEKQAQIFVGHRTLGNRLGTAPGFHLNLSRGGQPRHVWIFPGVPHELEGMIEADLESWLASVQSHSRFRRVIKIAGMAESAVEEELVPFYAKYEEVPVTILASKGQIEIHLYADGSADEAYSKLNDMEQGLREIFGDRIFGLDGEGLESVVGRLLSGRGETIATAESCTGGLLASRFTDVSGSSAYFMGGVVTYSAPAKLALLGVDEETIGRVGEVSEQVATQMATGARSRFGTTYGVGITGIAGPTGGTEKKPVGTVHIAVAGDSGGEHRKYQFVGSRELIKYYSTQMALNMVRLMIQRGR